VIAGGGPLSPVGSIIGGVGVVGAGIGPSFGPNPEKMEGVVTGTPVVASGTLI